MSQVTEDLQISVEEPAAWGRKLVITVPPERVKSERTRVARQLAKKVRIPGFRKGKVPPDRIEARYGGEIDRQTQQRIIDTAFREAIEAKDLDPISEPRVQNVVYHRDSEFTFEVSFDVRPEIKLARLGGFRIERPEVTVLDSEVEEQLDALRQQQALWSPVERKPTAGDTVEVVITPIPEAEAEGEEPASSQPYKFTLGQGQAIPDVEAAIMTLEPDSEGQFEVRFPDDFDDESRRGAKTRLQIELKRVLEQELPALDDELAKSVGDFEDLDELRNAVADDIRKHKEHEAEQQVNRQLVDHVIEANPFELPESMVDRYIQALMGTPPEGADPEQVAQARDEARPLAIRGIKRSLILQQIAEEQGFEVSKEEVDQRVKSIAERLGRPVGQVRGKLAKSGELRDIERGLVESKVFDYLREASEIKGAGS